MPIATLTLYREYKELHYQNGLDTLRYGGEFPFSSCLESVCKYSPIGDFALGVSILLIGSFLCSLPAIGYTFIGLSTLYIIITGIVLSYLKYRENLENQERRQQFQNQDQAFHAIMADVEADPN